MTVYSALAAVVGFEPTDNGVKVQCLDRLATPQYNGADKETRTPTPCLEGRCANH